MAYQPIENHGIIGNMHTAALVSFDGSIDWFCVPRFDSPSVFGAILDDEKGGRFRIAPTDPDFVGRQFYWPDTNVLITHFFHHDSAIEITDFMPMRVPNRGAYAPLIRRVKATRGTVRLQLECFPAMNYGRDAHHVQLCGQGAVFQSEALHLGLSTRVPLRSDGQKVTADFTLQEGQTQTFLLRVVNSETDAAASLPPPVGENEGEGLLADTVDYWRAWIAKCSYVGRWREMVHRSALVLQLLVYEPTGAVVAAATTSLPESLGGERNWDYRYSWIRDSAFTVYALLSIGLTDEADRFMNWLQTRCEEIKTGSLQTVYGIDGCVDLTEETLDHWQGYRGSRPVRIGNGAHKQLQADIYGELMDAVYLYNKHAAPISSHMWGDIRRTVDWICTNWQAEDNGIWEVRAGRQHFLYSKLMGWVALDRGLRLAVSRSLPADLDRWLKTRDTIYEQILYRGWNEKLGAFVQAYGSDVLDSASLVMPLVFFIAPGDPRMLSTLDAICRPPSQGGLLSDRMVYRYNSEQTQDGLPAGEGTFNMCTFWLVEALTRAGRRDPARLEQARLIFENMLKQANHLGLYSEETSLSGQALGNFPQAFAHWSFISAALDLDRALDNQFAKNPRTQDF